MKFKYIWNNIRSQWRVKKSLREAEREKRRCAALYPDWRDDEYNMGPCKFIWGLQRTREANPSFCTLNDIMIYYNRDIKIYFLLIDFPVNLYSQIEQLQFLINLLQEMRTYMKSLPEGYTFAPRINSDFCEWSLSGETIDELYTKFAILISGYKTVVKKPD